MLGALLESWTAYELGANSRVVSVARGLTFPSRVPLRTSLSAELCLPANPRARPKTCFSTAVIVPLQIPPSKVHSILQQQPQNLPESSSLKLV